jgi:hypothetical protein
MNDVPWHLNHAKHGNTPWAVQVEAMKRSRGRKKYGYWLEQGLGKTPLTLNDWVESGLNCLVVMCPSTFRIDWMRAPAEWGLDGVAAGYWPAHPPPQPGKRSVYAVNYEATRGRGLGMLEKLLSSQRCFLAFDETSWISNFNSGLSKSCIGLSYLAEYVRGLNGTPLTRNVCDYWSQVRILGGLNGKNPYAFRNRYGKKGGFMGRQIVGTQNDEELAELLGKYAFRAMKADWRKDLPPQIWHSPSMVEMTKIQRQHYLKMLEEFGTEIEGREISVSLILNQASKLQQIASGIITDGEFSVNIIPWAENPKIAAVKDIHESGSNKTIVSYIYRDSGKQLHAACTAWGLCPAWFRGQMSPEEQAEQKRRFNDDPDCRIMIAQQFAVCRGHTLIGGEGNDRCTRLIYYENSYSLGDRLQMNDRIHRGDQDQPCDYFDLCAGPIDLVPIAALRDKKNVADRVDDLVVALQGWRNL